METRRSPGEISDGLPPAQTAAAPCDGTDIEWEETACLLCGGRESSLLLEAAGSGEYGASLRFKVVQCRGCGLCFTNPRPGPASLGRFYPPEYKAYEGCGLAECQRQRALAKARTLAFWRAKNPFRRALPREGGSRLLDFGCGQGAFLELMHIQGWQVVGLDMCADVVQRIRRELGLSALAGTLPHPELSPAQFDVVTMRQSLEHVPRPLETLQHAYDLLVPGGKLLVHVPNVQSRALDWFGPAWFCLKLPVHLTHFSPQTLRQMVQRTGFHVQRVRMVRTTDWLCQSALLAHQSQSPGPHWLRRRWLARLMSTYLCWTRRSDCLLLVAQKPALERRGRSGVRRTA
jgi:2-polyprenyl-3-methyl-5-hydroxy-6-metoxy-1,4-benzoquinol methylase